MKKSFVLLWASIISILIFFWVYFPTLSRYRDLKIQEDGMTRELADLNQKINTLSEEKNLLVNDTDYLEKVIRDELGLVKPGEIVYKFVPTGPEIPAPPTGANTAITNPGTPSNAATATIPSPAGKSLQTPAKTSSAVETKPAKADAPVKKTTAVTPKKSSKPKSNSAPVYPRTETR